MLVALLHGAHASCVRTTSLGCFADFDGHRALTGYTNLGTSQTPLNHDLCAQQCADHGNLTLAGVEFGHQCFCGTAVTKGQGPSSGCTMACSFPGSSSSSSSSSATTSEICGGSDAIEVFEYHCSGKPTPEPPAPTPPPTPPPAFNLCPAPYDRPYCDPSQTLEARIAMVLAHMTPQDKMDTMAERSIAGTFSDGTPLVARPVSWWNEALHGLRVGCQHLESCATQFAEANAMSCSFNRTLWRATGIAISSEARALFNEGHLGGLTFFAPQINMAANPLWGRNMECAGEDPFLTSEFAFAYVDAMQSSNVSKILKTVTTPKHFMGQLFEGDGSDPWNNGTTVNRQSNDTRYALHDLERYYLPPFKRAMKDAKAGSVMCAYQGVNGVPMCANGFILNRVVRQSWGWKGFVVSDCDAIKTMMIRGSPGANTNFGHAYSLSGAMAVQDGVRAGCDSNCGDPYRMFGAAAIAQGLVTHTQLDASVKRLLRPMFQLGLFDPPHVQPPWAFYNWSHVGTEEHKQLALEGARQSLVLLSRGRAKPGRTSNAPLLPLPRGTKLLVAGPLANATRILLGNYNGDACHGGQGGCLPSLAQSIMSFNGAAALTSVVSAESNGCAAQLNQSLVDATVATAKVSDVVVLVLGGECHEGEGTDRDSLFLPGYQSALLEEVIALNVPLVVVIINGGPYAIDAIAGRDRIAILQASFPGQAGGLAIAEALFGETNPSGKLTTTIYPASYAHGEPLGGTPWMDSGVRPDGAANAGRTHMWYTGTPLFPFGYGLSYTSFELSFVAPSGGNATVKLVNVTRALSALTYHIRVKNVGTRRGKETVLAFWSPPDTVDPLLRQQLVGFEGVTLDPGKSAVVTLVLPSAHELATVEENGDRNFYVGDYVLRFSRGHGNVLETSVRVVAEAEAEEAEGRRSSSSSSSAIARVSLSAFPSRWVEGHELTVDACVEGTSDVVAHTELFLVEYKLFAYDAASKRLVHTASKLCVTRSDSSSSGGGGELSLSKCVDAAATQEWVYASASGALSPAVGMNSSDAGSSCIATGATNASMLRRNVTLVSPCPSGADAKRGSWTLREGMVISRLAGGASPLCLAARAEGIYNSKS